MVRGTSGHWITIGDGEGDSAALFELGRLGFLVLLLIALLVCLLPNLLLIELGDADVLRFLDTLVR